jgi:uncharacterized membrane protein YwzB
MNNILKISLIFLTLTIGSLLFFQSVQAQSPILTDSKIDEYNNKLSDTGFRGGYSAGMSLEQMIAFVLKMVLSVLGTIFIVMMFVAGNDWMQAAGNEEKIKKAKQRIQSLIVGLVIILLAYALSSGFSKLLVQGASLLK